MVPFKKWAEAASGLVVVVVDQLLALLAAGPHCQLHVTCDAHFQPLSIIQLPKYKSTQRHRLVDLISQKYKNTKVLARCNTWMAPISSLCLLYGSPH